MVELRVALDSTAVTTGRTGIAVYVRELVRALESEGVRSIPYTVGRGSHPPLPGSRRVVLPARIVHRLWRAGLPPRPEGLAADIDIVHAASLAVPATKRPLVVTAYDLVGIEHPRLHPRRTVKQQQALVQDLHRADAVATISEATAEAIANTGFPRDRIVVAYPGLSPVDGPVSASPIEGPYLLALGEQHPRKGLDVLLRAFAALPDRSLQLVHAGPAGEASDDLAALVAELGVGQRVRCMGFVPRPTVASLLHGATALCFPSWSEGFGLPVLEAMAAGTPVVASDIPSVRELAAGNALLVSPGDVEGLASSLQAVIDDDGRRAALAVGGRARAAAFTWQATARATRLAYELAAR